MTDRLARNLALFKTHPLFIGVDLGSSPERRGLIAPSPTGKGLG